jgi:hypothetical protein
MERADIQSLATSLSLAQAPDFNGVYRRSKMPDPKNEPKK